MVEAMADAALTAVRHGGISVCTKAPTTWLEAAHARPMVRI